MQIVIDIPEETYQDVLKNGFIYDEDNEVVTHAIKKGTPLPKGHGDLVDRDAINERFYSIYNDAMNCSNQPSDKYLLNSWSMCLDTASTIIEADTESEE